MDPDYLIFRSCYGFSNMVRMEIGVIVLFIAAVYTLMLLFGGFNDIIERRHKINKVRRKWQDQELKKK